MSANKMKALLGHCQDESLPLPVRQHLTALASIANHVQREGLTRLDDIVDGALSGCGLMPEAPTSFDWGDAAQRARADVAAGERAVMAYRRDQAVTIALGDSLGVSTRAGALLARLLTHPGDEPWVVVGVRPGSSQVLRREREAAERIVAAARLVDLPLAAVVLVTTKGTTLLATRGD